MSKSNLTAELMKEAMRTAHIDCGGEEGCIHAHATVDNIQQITETLRTTAEAAVADGLDPLFSAYYKGLHDGYRLAQLMFQSTDLGKAN